MQSYLLDENISSKLAERLIPVFQHVSHVANEGLINSSDRDIWSFARTKQMVIITKDNDFAEMSHLYGCPPKVVKLNCGNKTTTHIERILTMHFDVIKDFVQSDSCYMEMV